MLSESRAQSDDSPLQYSQQQASFRGWYSDCSVESRADEANCICGRQGDMMQNWSKQMDGIAGILAVYKKEEEEEDG